MAMMIPLLFIFITTLPSPSCGYGAKPIYLNWWLSQRTGKEQPNDRRVSRRPSASASSPRRLANDQIYGLTDDGDFAILGVNVEETTDVAEAGGGGLDLSALMAATSFSGSSGDVVEGPAGGSGPSAASRAGMSAGAGAGEAASAVTMGDTPASGSTGCSGGALIPDEVDVKALEDIEEWLLTIIPQLTRTDVKAYARGLGGIGFHPECVTMCELRYEDLGFMRILHRRYFYNEVTGVEHPWEA